MALTVDGALIVAVSVLYVEPEGFRNEAVLSVISCSAVLGFMEEGGADMFCDEIMEASSEDRGDGDGEGDADEEAGAEADGSVEFKK
jgi:hypothetical protein